MPTSELDVLKPIDPSITNSDDYEIFTLSNAQVSYKSNGRSASLLHAYADTPLKVEGKLEVPDRSQSKYLVKKPFKPIDIVIPDVTRFSYGQTQDGDTVIWALGEAGWFELRPARNYKEIFDDMVEAVEILYFVTDIYNEPRKRGGGPTATLLFQEYAEDERFACTDPEEAAKIFYKHRAFLFMCFLNRAQGVAWSNTPLYQYYKKQCPKDWETAKARIGGRVEKDERPAKGETTLPVRSSVPKAKQKGKAKQKTIESEAPKKDDNWWESAAIFEFMQKAVNVGAMHIGHITIDKVAKLIVKRYEIDELETAINVLKVHAQNLCYIMDHPRRKSVRYFASEQIYEELSGESNLSAAETRRAAGIELRPRKTHGTLKDDISSSEEEEEDSSGVETPRRRPTRAKKGRLSVLRPTSGKYSGKGKKAQGKGTGKALLIDPTSEEESEGVLFPGSESDSDPNIDTPTQALSPGKRKHTADVSDINPRKRAASGSAELESPVSSSDETDTPTEPLPLRWRAGNTSAASSTLLPPIISTPLPEYTANGPGDSWLCSFDGCVHKVYGASTDVGHTLIKEHFEDHARGRQKEIGIIMSEEQKLRLPVNNLLKRIREMAEQQTPLIPPNTGSSGPTAVRPRPIERSI